MMKAFRSLAALRRLRGTPLDLFGYSEERRMERRLLAEYEGDLDVILRSLGAGKIDAAAALASIPAMIRGYGHVKQASVVKAADERKRLVERFNAPVEEVALQAAE